MYGFCCCVVVVSVLVGCIVGYASCNLLRNGFVGIPDCWSNILSGRSCSWHRLLVWCMVMNVAFTVITFFIAIVFLFFAGIAVAASKHNKESLWLAAFFGFIGCLIIYLLVHNCNYGVCNI